MHPAGLDLRLTNTDQLDSRRYIIAAIFLRTRLKTLTKGLTMSAELQSPRHRIDEIDRQLVQLIAERMSAVRSIGQAKGRDTDAPLRDQSREQFVLANWQAEAQKQGLSDYFVGRILREVLNYSRRIQEEQLDRSQEDAGIKQVRVGFLGISGSYSDLCVSKLFAERPACQLQRSGYGSFAKLVDAVESGEIKYALLPIENTIAGSLHETYRLLADRQVSIVDEEILAIEHCLVGLPGATVDQLRVIRSHPVALQQCASWIDSQKNCVTEGRSDTATSAASVLADNDPSVGAICSEEVAGSLELNILARGIDNKGHNYTRFVLVAREPETVDVRRPARVSLLLMVNHRRGALARCLDAFARRSINLTKLESRANAERPWEYLFYLDIEGHREEPRVKEALDEILAYANTLKELGCYPRRGAFGEDLEPEEHQVEEISESPQPAVNVVANDSLRRSGRQPEREPSVVKIGRVPVGAGNFMLIAGPCAVETRAQITAGARMVRELGGQVLRGGAFKPRSSPYSFQGLGFPGLDLLREAGDTYELPVITEVLRLEDVNRIAQSADALQVGARNMQNFELLKVLGKIDRPVLLKRGLSASIADLLAAAEYIMAGGNQQVILCERGIRTFETATRSTLDISAIPVLKERTHLPVIVDPSHAAGRRELVLPLAAAAVAAGADGLIVECHPNPEQALCDKEQALTHQDMEELMAMLSQAGKVGLSDIRGV
ncbi:MAG: 3-deoxy-7-phosphoheptulonate synthase [Candidatus Krumholzibacteriia bacterium]